MNGWSRFALAVCAAFLVAGCQSMGAGSVQRDRLGYANAIGTSWKEQALLNIVKMRYLDTPVFLEVSSVISSYELAGEISLSSNLFPGSPLDTNRTFGATGTYADKPTISYVPVTGDRYMTSQLRPISPQAIFAMIESGHSADFVLRLTVRAINGLYNHQGPGQPGSSATFSEVIAAFRRIQQAGALSVRIEKRGTEEITRLRFARDMDNAVEKDVRYIQNALGINASDDDTLLVFGALRPEPGRIALLTRSVQQILSDLSAGVEVPQRDLDEERATARLPVGAATDGSGGALIRIRSAADRPADAYAAVRYRDLWFWIDDRDLASKRVMMFLMVFSSLAETGAAPQTPLITIPAR